MDIFNRPPAISEDTLHYILHPSTNPDRPSVLALATVIREFVDTLLPNHLWHRDGFQLMVNLDEDEKQYVIEGRMRVGDCVDDEWCAVWLLREISSKWDVVVSVSDTDGEFLLIEAAEHLPSWVTPTNAENRVWIYNYHLHLVPLAHVSSPSTMPRRSRYVGMLDSDDEDASGQSQEHEDYITTQDAIKVVRDPSVDTRAPQLVEDAVVAKIRGYPAAARQHTHFTKVHLPVDIAKALSVEPSLIQKPVEIFYTRDAIQLRAAHKMSRFPPEPSVLTTVKMTRTAYAQLLGQKFYPPKAFGRWQEREGTSERKRKDIGMKLACGFEMLYQESKGKTTAFSPASAEISAEARKEALQRDADYLRYLQNLVPAGYFKEETKDSSLWKHLENKAAKAYIEARREDSLRQPFAFEVNAAIARASEGFISIREEDPEDWLNVDPSDFDTMLKQAVGHTQAVHTSETREDVVMPSPEDIEDHVANQQAERLRNLAKKVESFVEGEGDLEGAQFEDETFSDDDSDERMSTESNEEDSLAPDDRTAAHQADIDKLVPGIEPGDYGKMPPSFHNNSQRIARSNLPTADSPATEIEHESLERSIRPPIIPRDKYDGVDSDDETDEEDEETQDEDEDMPQLVGDVEIDMEEEQEEFLEFARQALGMSDGQWRDIIKDRESRGAYVPAPDSHNRMSQRTASDDALRDTREVRPTPQAETLPKTNFDLNSFEAVMKAMDSELARAKAGKSAPLPSRDKGKGVEREVCSEADDIETAMDAELRAALGSEDIEEGEDIDRESPDYGLIKNFLESFKNQAGLPGPVSSLVGRLEPGWSLPRDS